MDWIKDRTKKQITLMRPFFPKRISMSCALVKSNIIQHNLMLGCTSRKYLISINFTFWHTTFKIMCSLYKDTPISISHKIKVLKKNSCICKKMRDNNVFLLQLYWLVVSSLYRSVLMDYARWCQPEVMYMNKF